MVSCSKASGIAMRIAIIMNFITGIVLIVFGCYVQNPPKSYAPVSFVILGSLNIFASMVGFWASFHKKRLLNGFLVCGGLSTLLQIGLTLSLLLAFEQVVKLIVKPEQDQKKFDKVSKQLNIARWVSLGFIFFELFSLVMAILLRFVIKEEQPYDPFSEDNQAQRTSALSALAKDISKAARSGKNLSEKAYDKIRQKMAAKYGAMSNSDSDWRSKTKFSWNAA